MRGVGKGVVFIGWVSERGGGLMGGGVGWIGMRVYTYRSLLRTVLVTVEAYIL